MAERRCENCEAFVEINQRGPVLDITKEPQGECRLMPPTVGIVLTQQGVVAMTQPPMVKRSHFCMQFRAKFDPRAVYVENIKEEIKE